MNGREDLWECVRIEPVDDPWHFPLDRWTVWKRGERLGDNGRAHRGFRRLSEAKTWASERFGVTAWARSPEGDGSYVPKDVL